MSTKKLREIGQRLVKAKVSSEAAADRYRSVREETQEALIAAHRKHGTIKTAVELPGLGQVASITLKTGHVSITVDEDALLETTRQHTPNEVEDVIDTAVLTDPKVIEAVRKIRPDAVKPRVRDAWRAAKIKEAAKSQGRILIPKTGEHVKIAEVERHERTGDFQLTWTDDGKTFVDAFAGDTSRASA